ncbi:MAG: hypothetical protein LBV12_07110 [Puniceicoccales bacterium]|jgi:hypothetical protein|nr:hypothetical protein [Puniceicoccales bacterium]
MKSEELEIFRKTLLAIFVGAGSLGATIPTLKVQLGIRGFDNPDDVELRNELDYLEEKMLIAQADKLISPENRRWKITASGRDFAALQGLA